MEERTRVLRERVEERLFARSDSGSLAYGVSVDGEGRRSVNGPFFQDMESRTFAIWWDLDTTVAHSEDVLNVAALLLRARFVERAQCDLSDVMLDVVRVEGDSIKYRVTGALK